MTPPKQAQVVNLTEGDLLHLDALVAELEDDAGEAQDGAEPAPPEPEEPVANAAGADGDQQLARDALGTIDGALMAVLDATLDIELGSPFGALVEARERAVRDGHRP
jgi:hypothetical protein